MTTILVQWDQTCSAMFIQCNFYTVQCLFSAMFAMHLTLFVSDQVSVLIECHHKGLEFSNRVSHMSPCWSGGPSLIGEQGSTTKVFSNLERPLSLTRPEWLLSVKNNHKMEWRWPKQLSLTYPAFAFLMWSIYGIFILKCLVNEVFSVFIAAQW